MSNFVSISNFINSNQLHVQRNNRFWLSVQNPNSSLDYMLCESVNLPTSGISSIPWQIDNKTPIYIPYARNYDNNQFTVTIRENILNGKAQVLPWFDDWLNLIIKKNPVTRKYEISYYNEFLGQADFRPLNIDGSFTHKIEFYNIYPISVKPSSYAYEETNTYNKIEVSFVFEEFKISTN